MKTCFLDMRFGLLGRSGLI